MDLLLYLISFLSVSFIGVLLVYFLFKKVMQEQSSDPRAAYIAKLIRIGAMTFLKKEYTILVIVIAIMASALVLFVNYLAAIVYTAGAASSMLAGYIGMKAATKANESTTLAAKNKGERPAFLTALYGGSVMGFVVASLGLIGLTLLFYFLVENSNFDFVQILACYGLGASSIALFARVGGGIYTKAADVGADLVGKVEMGIPEDDPRNPAVIADNVGDCVGDTAGMGADIFESYVGATVAAIALAFGLFKGQLDYIALPITLIAIGLISSIIGIGYIAFVKGKLNKVMLNGTYVAMGAFILGSFIYLKLSGLNFNLFGSIAIGALAGILVGVITDYYTSGRPVRKLAETSCSGAGTNLIYGLSVGFESIVIPVCSLGMAVYFSYTYFGELFGVSLAGVAMLATVGITMAVDAYGPIADNAGGISEMSGFGKEVRQITDRLDSLGNTTAALGKGFAIGSAALTALAVFAAYCQEAHILSLNLLNPIIIAGMFIGGAMPFLISSMTMRSVGNAAWKMVQEVRRQFREIPGLKEGKTEPDYEKCISISTKAALIEMLLPGALTVLVPVFIRFVFGASGKMALGGFLAGATLTGVVLALTMANAGGAWDNAKKYIEAGNFGGKGSDAHKAAVVGDTVGDPFKDTSGPSLNILIKLMSMISLLLATL